MSLLAIAGAMSLQAADVDWKLTPPVTVEKADYFLDGGSVSVVLRGSGGERRYVHLMSPEVSPEDGGGMLSFRYEKGGKSTRLPPNSQDEKRLLQLLRTASVNTFGTSDYSALHNEKAGVTKNKGFSSLAMGSLFRRFDHKPTEKEAQSGPRE